MWLVAVSGGPDSMALLDWCVQQKRSVAVAHVNYNRRKSSMRDQKIVESYCRKHDIVCHVLMLGNDEISGNFQHVARHIRYDFFKKLVHSFNYEGVLVAHHQLDVLETFLIKKKKQLLGVFPGIQQRVEVDGLHIERPILNWSKDQVTEYLKNNHIEYGIDETNETDDYTRNRIRKELLMQTEAERNQLVHSYQEAVAHYNHQRSLVDTVLNKVDQTMPIEAYLSMIPDLRVQFLRAWMGRCGFDIYTKSRDYFEELDRQLQGESVYLEQDDLLLSLSYGELFCGCVRPFEIVMDAITFGDFGRFSIEKSGNKRQGLSVSDVDFPLTFRSPRPDDVIELSYGTKALRRWFIDQKTPRHCRKLWLIVANASNHVIFVAELGSDKHHCSNNPLLFVIE